MITNNIFSNISSFGWSIIFLITAWSIVWKGIALWKAAKNSDKAWFIALLIINTIGILEIFYIYIFSKRNEKDKK